MTKKEVEAVVRLIKNGSIDCARVICCQDLGKSEKWFNDFVKKIKNN